MKSIFKICFVAVLFFSVGMVNAQTLKFAHIDTQVLIQAMPEAKTAQATIEKEAKGLEDQMGTLQKEYQTKLQDLSDKQDSLTEIVYQSKVEELQSLQQRIQSFNSSAQQRLQQKQSELMQPIFAKANETIEAVAKEQGVIYVFDANNLLYKSNQSIDLLPLVKAKLGIQ
ncbi:OmpH family outer membrane protein [uncultured Sunxiuqinia sp.]|uniref:OmpH family outer membrane protein n=1 Tax=uncultured Sunxiuqinia sp. TaxID=1573825 RepID=UPI002AA810EE|nr:OmpH family outer membrane protein [uncultured Sunxiuqinia sp.]